jgi:prepilin-type N-terminal cleavage/methylation domain-containing protein
LKKRAFRKGIKMIARKGFTLVEVLLVVVIIAVLASIVIPRIAESAKNANVAKCDANRANLISAIERYAINNKGTYPDVIGKVLNTTYFPHGLPICPYSTDDGVASFPYVYSGDAAGGTITAHSHP